jgi:hypothetical protein
VGLNHPLIPLEHPGKITDEELEKEKGGSGLRYSFDIKNGGVTHEVGVDAKTGKLLENSVEGKSKEPSECDRFYSTNLTFGG